MSDVKPRSYLYRYMDPMSGRTVWRSDNSLWNGQRPAETEALYSETDYAALEAKLAKAVEGLTVIDALDPEGLVNGCSQSALIGLVLRMGEIARAALAAAKAG